MKSELPAVNCSSCHEDVQQVYAQSIHATSAGGKIYLRPSAGIVNGSHYVLAALRNSASTIFP